jgi:hypothetical protein
VPVQAQVGHQSLQLRVLVSQLTELAQFAQPESGIPLLLQIERLLADAVLATDFHHAVPRLRFPQYPQDLLFAMSSLRHLAVLLPLAENHDRPLSLNFQMA